MDTAAEKPSPAFVDPGKRTARVPLEFPLTFEGKLYDAIMLRRMTAQDISDYIETVAANAKDQPDTHIRFPIYFHTDGEPIPTEVFVALDGDDSETLQKAALNFLPRSFRVISKSEAAE